MSLDAVRTGCAALLAVLSVAACGSDAPVEVLDSSALIIDAPGAAPRGECKEVGSILVNAEPREPGVWTEAANVEMFFNSLSAQAEALDANHVVPLESEDPERAANEGTPFRAKAYRCSRRGTRR